MLKRRIILPAVLMAASLLPAAQDNPPGAPPALELTLRPAAPDTAGIIPSVDVTLVFPVFATVELAFLPNNVETVARTITLVTARDAAGPLPLRVTDDPESAEGPARHWSAGRPVQGPVTLRYRAPISNRPAPRGAAPPLELRSDTGAFSGAGASFLLLPRSAAPDRLRLHWDLSAMPAGARGVSSLGSGDRTVLLEDAIGRLKSTFFLAGRLQLFPEQPPERGFFSAWHGTPPMDLARLMASEQKLYAFYEKFFSRPAESPYGVFLRENPVNPGGGMGLTDSFIATFGPKVTAEDLTITLAHEMLHTFAGGLDQPAGLEGSWFSEGLAVHYARLLALRAGQITPAEFLHDLNSTAGRYYTNAFLGTPNSEIPKRFWADTRIRVLPYDRGSLYFAVLDTQLRAASHAQTGLDELLMQFLARRKRALPLDETAWCSLLEQALGTPGPESYRAMLAGALQLPESGAFGPQFERTTTRLRRYELGFAPEVLIEPRRVVRGLKEDSAAARAGLRNGDEITRPVPQDVVQAQQEATLTLHVSRAGQSLVITYLPRGEEVDAWQWRMAGGPPRR
ncbi:M61 metallopeptidase family protein [Paludibaculum fermentans]|uniref:Peptidase M61 n=1 Tax=Paludibaculum fermentans TaxID=1473598 RepID=A0A7S7SJF0_PALFE|nr:peptidase M61 [Paludibaculum fermentans]QOY88012.1 peptidase M61 [Paludibaculum fermentans]